MRTAIRSYERGLRAIDWLRFNIWWAIKHRFVSPDTVAADMKWNMQRQEQKMAIATVSDLVGTLEAMKKERKR